MIYRTNYLSTNNSPLITNSQQYKIFASWNRDKYLRNGTSPKICPEPDHRHDGYVVALTNDVSYNSKTTSHVPGAPFRTAYQQNFLGKFNIGSLKTGSCRFRLLYLSCQTAETDAPFLWCRQWMMIKNRWPLILILMWIKWLQMFANCAVQFNNFVSHMMRLLVSAYVSNVLNVPDRFSWQCGGLFVLINKENEGVYYPKSKDSVCRNWITKRILAKLSSVCKLWKTKRAFGKT